MGFLDIFKAFFLPALIAGAIYLIGVFIILPLVRRHQHYSQYLPLEAISARTSSFRDRMVGAIITFVTPRRTIVVDAEENRRGSASGDDFVFEEADGDRMVGFDVNQTDRQIRGGNISVTRGRAENMV